MRKKKIRDEKNSSDNVSLGRFCAVIYFLSFSEIYMLALHLFIRYIKKKNPCYCSVSVSLSHSMMRFHRSREILLNTLRLKIAAKDKEEKERKMERKKNRQRNIKNKIAHTVTDTVRYTSKCTYTRSSQINHYS